MTDANVALLSMQGICKHYVESEVWANRDVDFTLRAGEIHALIGENGAGKTTLMRILCGLERPDSGEIRYRGRVVRIRSSSDAERLRIGMVHQQFCLIRDFSVADNVVLNKEPRAWFLMYDRKAASASVLRIAKEFEFHIDPSTPAGALTVGEKQRVEILRVLYRGSTLLVLDEPTSLLTEQEIRIFFSILRQLKSRGHTIVIITHKLEEVVQIADRVTVMRAGRVVGTDLTANATMSSLARLMVGKEVVLQVTRPPLTAGGVVLRIQGLTMIDASCARPILNDVDLRIRAGEVLGIAGVAGNGLGDLENVLTGMSERNEVRGEALLNGVNLLGLHPGRLRALGMAYVPADRLQRGSSLGLSLSDNLMAVDHHELMRADVQIQKRVAAFSGRMIDEFSIKGSARAPIGMLSGGNIQRAVQARELSRNPSLLLVSEPTWGLDILSSEFVYRQIVEMRARGTAVLLISSNLDEILALSDRIAVMYRGEIAGQFDNEGLDREFLGSYMLGLKRQKKAGEG
jgi:general nucleoside transport system ATP-binding protein